MFRASDGTWGSNVTGGREIYHQDSGQRHGNCGMTRGRTRRIRRKGCNIMGAAEQDPRKDEKIDGII